MLVTLDAKELLAAAMIAMSIGTSIRIKFSE